jgi:hypothetical protein
MTASCNLNKNRLQVLLALFLRKMLQISMIGLNQGLLVALGGLVSTSLRNATKNIVLILFPAQILASIATSGLSWRSSLIVVNK